MTPTPFAPPTDYRDRSFYGIEPVAHCADWVLVETGRAVRAIRLKRAARV